MKNFNLSEIKFVAFVLTLIGVVAISTSAADVIAEINKEQLEKMLDNPDVVILDVRNSEDWQKSNYKIRGAVRRQPKFFDAWAGDFPRDRVLVLY